MDPNMNIMGFVNPENDDEKHRNCLNSVVIEMHRNFLSMLELIQFLKLDLTNDKSDKRRMRSMLLLAEVLIRLPDLKLNSSTKQVLYQFFIERLNDFSTLSQCLLAIEALEKHHGIELSNYLAMFEIIFFAEINQIPSYGQSVRKQIYEIVLRFLGLLETQHKLAGKVPRYDEIVRGFVASMEGEKDPRNLLVCLKVAAGLIEHSKTQNLNDGESVKVENAPLKNSNELEKLVLDGCACYFPITFRPPPNDPFGIQPEELSLGLRVVFTKSNEFRKYTIPLILEKLGTSMIAAKREGLLALKACLAEYDTSLFEKKTWQDIQSGLYQEIVQGQDVSIVENALELVSLATEKITRNRTHKDDMTGWKYFVLPFVQLAVVDIGSNALDSMIAISGSKIVQAIGKGSIFAFHEVMKKMMPIYQGKDGNSETLLVHLRLYIDIMEQDVELSDNTLEEYIPFMYNAFSQAANSNVEYRGSAIEGLYLLILKTKRNWIKEGEIKIVIQRLSELMLNDQVQAVQALTALQRLCSLYSNSIMEITLPKLMSVINSDDNSEETFILGLHAMAELCIDTSLFESWVQSLMDNLRNKFTDPTTITNSSLRRVNAIIQAMVHMIEYNGQDTQCIDFCIAGNQNTSVVQPLLSMLLNFDYQLIQKASTGNITLEAVQQIVHSVALLYTTIMKFATCPQQLSIFNFVYPAYFDEEPQPKLKTLTSSADGSSLLLLIAFSIISAMHKKAEIPGRCNIVTALIEQLPSLTFPNATNGSCQHTTYIAALHCISSLVNKMDKGESLNQLISNIVDPALKHLLNNTFEQLEQDKVAWLTKGLLLRAHPKGLDITCVILECLRHQEDSALQQQLSNVLHELLSDQFLLPIHAPHWNSNLLRKHRIYNTMYPKFVEYIKHNKSKELEMHLLCGLCGLLATTPKKIMLSDRVTTLPLIIKSVAFKMENGIDGPVGASLPTLLTIIKDSKECVIEHLSELVPGLLGASQNTRSPDNRVLALECIGLLAEIEYHHLHPYKAEILRKLGKCLDDSKKRVRSLAVLVRNKWAIL